MPFFAGIFEVAAQEPAVFGILLASQTAFHIFLFSDSGQLSQAARSEEPWRRHVGYGCVAAFLIGLGCAVGGLALAEPRPLLAFVATGMTVIQALCVGLLPVVSDLKDPAGREGMKMWAVIGASVVVVVFVIRLAPILGDDGAPNLAQDNYATIPSDPAGFAQLKANRLRVVLCLHPGKTGCAAGSPHARVFRLHSLHHEDVKGGGDFWDYSFTRAGDPLRFLYRKNPGQGSHWGFVRGETDENTDFSENKVYGLHDFGDTGLARNVLEPQADDTGMRWAEEGGVITTTHESGSASNAILAGAFLLLVFLIGVFILLVALWAWRSRPS